MIEPNETQSGALDSDTTAFYQPVEIVLLPKEVSLNVPEGGNENLPSQVLASSAEAQAEQGPAFSEALFSVQNLVDDPGTPPPNLPDADSTPAAAAPHPTVSNRNSPLNGDSNPPSSVDDLDRVGRYDSQGSPDPAVGEGAAETAPSGSVPPVSDAVHPALDVAPISPDVDSAVTAFSGLPDVPELVGHGQTGASEVDADPSGKWLVREFDQAHKLVAESALVLVASSSELVPPSLGQLSISAEPLSASPGVINLEPQVEGELQILQSPMTVAVVSTSPMLPTEEAVQPAPAWSAITTARITVATPPDVELVAPRAQPTTPATLTLPSSPVTSPSPSASASASNQALSTSPVSRPALTTSITAPSPVAVPVSNKPSPPTVAVEQLSVSNLRSGSVQHPTADQRSVAAPSAHSATQVRVETQVTHTPATSQSVNGSRDAAVTSRQFQPITNSASSHSGVIGKPASDAHTAPKSNEAVIAATKKGSEGYGAVANNVSTGDPIDKSSEHSAISRVLSRTAGSRSESPQQTQHDAFPGVRSNKITTVVDGGVSTRSTPSLSEPTDSLGDKVAVNRQKVIEENHFDKSSNKDAARPNLGGQPLAQDKTFSPQALVTERNAPAAPGGALQQVPSATGDMQARSFGEQSAGADKTGTGRQGGSSSGGRGSGDTGEGHSQGDGQGGHDRRQRHGRGDDYQEGYSPSQFAQFRQPAAQPAQTQQNASTATRRLSSAFDAAIQYEESSRARSGTETLFADLSLKSGRQVDLVAQGLDKLGYAKEAVSVVTGALQGDLNKLEAFIGESEAELNQIRNVLFATPQLSAFSDEVRGFIWGEMLKGGDLPASAASHADWLPNEVMESLKAVLSQSEFSPTLAKVGAQAGLLNHARDVRDALKQVIEEPTALVPMAPVYALSSESISRVDWLPGSQSLGAIVISRQVDGELREVELDVARTVDGQVVMGRRSGGLFSVLDRRGRATHEYTEVAQGLWDVSFAEAGDNAPVQRELRSLLERGKREVMNAPPALAQRTFDSALALDPRNKEALIGSAETLLAQHRSAEALAMLNVAVATDPHEPRALFLRAQALQAEGMGSAAHLSFSAADAELNSRMSGPVFEHSAFWSREDVILRGRVLLALDRTEEARGMFEHLIHGGDHAADVRVGLGTVLLRSGQVAEARREFLRAIEQDPKSTAALVGQARAEALMGYREQAVWSLAHAAGVCFEKGQMQQALDIFEELLKAAPDNHQALTGAGFAHDRLSHPLEAADCFARAGEVCLREGRLEDARRNFEYALMRAKNHLRAEVGRGQVLLSLGDAERAMESFDRVLRLEPTHVPALIGKGQAYLAEWNYAAACDCFDQVLEFEPTNLSALVSAGQVYLKTGAHSLASYSFDLARDLAPNDPQVLLGRAECDLAMGDARAAFQRFESLLQFDPRNERAINGRVAAMAMMEPDLGSIDRVIEAAVSLESRGKWGDALDLYQRASRVVPEDVRVWAGIGQSQMRLQDAGSALAAFEQALELDPDNIECLLGAARSHMAVKNFEAALLHFDAACRNVPMDSAGHIGRGEALLALRRFEEALDCFGAALQIDPHNLLGFVGKGQAHLGMGELDAAQRSFSYALGIEPGNGKAIAGTQEIFTRMQKSH